MLMVEDNLNYNFFLVLIMINFVILCGGLGKRFQTVSKELPKILIDINHNGSMLNWLLNEYIPQGSSVILSTGHLHEKIFDYLKKNNYNQKIKIANESTPLGTGGALCNASRFVDTEEFIALNGDTIHELSINSFLEKSNLINDISINVGCTLKNKNDSGKLLIDDSFFIKKFSEKKLPKFLTKENLKLVSSLGIYRCKSSFFKSLPISYLSLEEDILPSLVLKNKAKASVFEEDFHDFGTYERYNNLRSNR